MTPVSDKKRAPRKIWLVTAMMILAASLAACAPAPVGPVAAPTQPAATEAPAATEPPTATEAPAATDAPTEAPATDAPTATTAPTEAPTEAPTATTAPTEAPAATVAPEPTAAPTEAPAAPAAVSFSSDLMPIFEQTCIKCHGGADGEKGGLNLTTHAELMQGGEDGQVVMPGDAANSMLWQLVDEGKMPRRQPRLPQEQIDLIAAWINQGALDN